MRWCVFPCYASGKDAVLESRLFRPPDGIVPMRLRLFTIALTAVMLMAMPRPVQAWGPDGHRIVCRIAYLLLESDERGEINRLTRLYRAPDGSRFQSFPESCGFADTARFKAQDDEAGWAFFNRFNRWHFLNVPRSTRRLNVRLCAGNCVLEGIEFHSARLADRTLQEQRRAEALLFLGHWVGDIHQPLHVSYGDDQGGNNVRISGSYYGSTHLHAVWDSGIIRRATGSGGWPAFATRLRNQITPPLRIRWSLDPPLVWAEESYAIAVSAEVDYCEWDGVTEGSHCRSEPHVRNFTQAYQKTFQTQVERRMQMAAARLAHRLRMSLGLR